MNYELMLVITPTADGKTFVSGVEKTVKDAGANSVKVENLGKKTLAYSIKSNREAEYYLINFEAEGEAIKVLNDKLRLEQEALLRYLIIKPSAKVTSAVSPKVTAKVTVETKTADKKSSSAKASEDKAKTEKKVTKAKSIKTRVVTTKKKGK